MGWTRQDVLDVARSTGYPVVEAWSDHDAGQMGTVVGPMLHHTGSTWSYPGLTAPTLRTVREGRSDLQNALCMYYIDYAGTIYCVTEKLAWHAGGGSWQGITDGNGHYAGIEAESDGVQWTDATVVSYKALAAAILRKTARTVAYAPRHAEYALPVGRKTDFSGLDGTAFRADVAAAINNLGGFLMALPDAEQQELLDKTRTIHRMLTDDTAGKDRIGDIYAAVAEVKVLIVGRHTDGSDRLADLWRNDNTHDAAIETKLDAITAALAKLAPPAAPAKP